MHVMNDEFMKNYIIETSLNTVCITAIIVPPSWRANVSPNSEIF